MGELKPRRAHRPFLFFLILSLFSLHPRTAERTTPLSTGTGGLPAISLIPAAGGLSRPVGIANAGDGSGRLFIVEQGGWSGSSGMVLYCPLRSWTYPRC